jgi:hypothetical protein
MADGLEVKAFAMKERREEACWLCRETERWRLCTWPDPDWSCSECDTCLWECRCDDV